MSVWILQSYKRGSFQSSREDGNYGKVGQQQQQQQKKASMAM